MSSCRSCHQPKWRGDPCTNPECPKVDQARTQTLRMARHNHQRICATKEHGFHELQQTRG